MVEYRQGHAEIYIPAGKGGAARKVHSILDIDLDEHLTIYILPGGLSENDIIIRYRDSRIARSRPRQPSHIHWAVDLLVKKVKNPELVDRFLRALEERWNSIEPLLDRTLETICEQLKLARDVGFTAEFSVLEQQGFFSVAFLVHLMELLMLQEKTNRPDAYMFKDVVNKILDSKDLYSIISAATYRSKR